MLIIQESDMHNHYDKLRRVEIIKYSNGVKKNHLIELFYIYQKDFMMEMEFLEIMSILLRRTNIRYQILQMLLVL